MKKSLSPLGFGATAKELQIMLEESSGKGILHFDSLGQRPSPSDFGIGLCQVGSDVYASDGSIWIEIGGAAALPSYDVLSIQTVTTSATPTAGATVTPTSAVCNGLLVKNGSQAVEYQRNGAGSFHRIRPGETKYIFGITNADQIGFRRTDYATARTTQTSSVTCVLINTSVSFTVGNLNVTTTSNSTYTAFPSAACVALEVTNINGIDCYLKVNATGATHPLPKNTSVMLTGITNANQISAVSYNNTSAVTLYGETFQAIPDLPRREWSRAHEISPTAKIFLGDATSGQSKFAMPSFFSPFTRFNGRGKTITMFKTVAASFISGGTSADTALASDENYPTNSPIAQYGANTAVTNTFGASTTNSFLSSLNAAYPIDVTDSSIHACIQRIGTGGTVSAVHIDLFSVGTPDNPDANYHTLNISNDINNGFAANNGYSYRSFGINAFSAVGIGAVLSAITYARFRVTGTSGLVVRPSEIKAIKNKAKASIVFTFDDSHSTAMKSAMKLMHAYGFPGVLYPSPNRDVTGGNGNPAGNITIDNMLALQHMHNWQIASQDWGGETTSDMTGTQWLEAQQKNFIQGAALGFDADGLRDGSYYGGGTYYITSEQYKLSQIIHTSLRRFDNGLGSLGDGVPALYFADTNPPGDPWNMRSLNIGTWPTTAGNENNTYLKIKSYIDLAVANKGICILADHTSWDNSVIYGAMQLVCAYIKTLEDAGTAEVLTLTDIRRKYRN